MTLESAWQRYKEFQDQAALEFLVQTYGHLVHNVLDLIHLPLGPMVEYEDAVSCGLLGLLDAFSKYDESQGFKFETYAIHRIRGEIRDGIREVQWQSRSIQEKAKQFQKVWQQLELALGRQPTEAEMAKALGLDNDTYQRTIEEIQPVNVISLDDVVFGGDGSGSILVEETIADTNNSDPTAFIEAEDWQQRLAQAIETLPEREKLAFTLRFYEELTEKEIGLVLGVSGSRVSQLLIQAYGRLQRQLEANERLSELSLNADRIPRSLLREGCQREAFQTFTNDASPRRGGARSFTQLQLSAEVIVIDLNRRRGGGKVAEVLKINDPQIKEAYYCLTRHARDKNGQLVVAEPGEILQYRKVDLYSITVLEKLGVMRRVGVDEWSIKAGVQFEILQLLVDQERKEEGMLSERDKTLNVVSVDLELAQAYYTLRKQVFQDAQRLVVAYPAEILGEKGFSSELVDRLVDEGLLFKPETDQDVLWELKEAAVVVKDAMAELTAPVQAQPTIEEPIVAVFTVEGSAQQKEQKPEVSQKPEQQRVQKEKREEVRKMADEVVVPGGSAIEKAHRLLVAAADEKGQVVGANVILEKAGFIGYTTDLKERGLIAPVVKEDGKIARVGKAVVWQVVGAQKAEVEEPASVSAKPEAVEEKPKHRIVPKAKPAQKKKPEEALPKPKKAKAKAKEPDKFDKFVVPVIVAKPRPTGAVAAKSVERELLERFVVENGMLKERAEIRANASFLSALAKVPNLAKLIEKLANAVTVVAENPEAFSMLLELSKGK